MNSAFAPVEYAFADLPQVADFGPDADMQQRVVEIRQGIVVTAAIALRLRHRFAVARIENQDAGAVRDMVQEIVRMFIQEARKFAERRRAVRDPGRPSRPG